MKIEIHKANDRGLTDAGWLNSRHSFSFNEYYNPKRMGFGALRVLNDDWVDPGQGFGMHPHRDMEIVTIVLQGALEHQDSMGNKGIIPAGDIQQMSAGKGIYHSEYNSSEKEPVHLLQIWIHTKEKGITPVYAQKSFQQIDRKNKLVPVVSGKKDNGSVYIHQDAAMYLGQLDKDISVTHRIDDSNKGIFLFVVEGEIRIGQEKLGKGDAVAVTETEKINIQSIKDSEILLIEVPYPWKNGYGAE